VNLPPHTLTGDDLLFCFYITILIVLGNEIKRQERKQKATFERVIKFYWQSPMRNARDPRKENREKAERERKEMK
jgi:hypothetical protein